MLFPKKAMSFYGAILMPNNPIYYLLGYVVGEEDYEFPMGLYAIYGAILLSKRSMGLSMGLGDYS